MNYKDIKTRPPSRIEVPVQFSHLLTMAYNLWWTWTPAAQNLFAMIDEPAWERYLSPIEVLIDLAPERWLELQSSREFVQAYREVVDAFDEYIFPRQPTWFRRNFPDHDHDHAPIAYFSTEFGWHESLQIYSGGLGVLSGDHSKSASELDLPFLGVGLMYRNGYFRQTIDADGQQQHFYPDYDLDRIPLLPVVDEHGEEVRVAVDISGRTVNIRLWKASVGRVPVLLLDTDLSDNCRADRAITSILYVSGREMRLTQEIVLGIGGVRALRALGIEPAAWHLNEGHSSLLGLERMADAMHGEGLSVEQAREQIAECSVFTTHTPVPAGNETFEMDLVRRYLGSWADGRLDLEPFLEMARNGDDPHFNLTALALRTSGRTNGVSRLHGEIAGGLWNHLLGDHPVESVTNGVHLATWLGPEVRSVLEQRVGTPLEEHLFDEGYEARVDAIPDEALWNAHQAQKTRLIESCRGRVQRQFSRHGRSPEQLIEVETLLDPDALLIGFARRFATYKRADLLLRDMDALRQIASDHDRPVQFVFAGKAHPADRPGQDLIRRIWQSADDAGLRGKLVFLENYNMRVGRTLVQGVDVWLNNPRRPMEASGTSGMKAAMNGGLNCSILDGWWCEGYDPEVGWSFGDPEDEETQEATDHRDAYALYEVLRSEVAPLYYDRDPDGIPHAWVARMKKSIGRLSGRFSTTRMVREYAERFYVPATRGALLAG